MRAEKLYEAIGTIEDDLLIGYENYEKEAGKKKGFGIARFRWAAAAACLAVLVTGAAVFKMQTQGPGTPPPANNQNIQPGQGEGPVPGGNPEGYLPAEPDGGKKEEPPQNPAGEIYVPAGEVIADFGNDGASPCYVAPKNGTWSNFIEVNAALEEYRGQDVVYFLGIDFFEDEKGLDWNSEPVRKELERLKDLGYKVGIAEYYALDDEEENGRSREFTAAGYFTAEELETFAAGGDYGYMFRFIKNGDGSAVSGDQGVITNFDSGMTS